MSSLSSTNAKVPSDDKPLSVAGVAWTAAIFAGVFVAVFLLAPTWLVYRSMPDAAAWAQLWLVPSGVIGLILSAIFWAKPRRVTFYPLLAVVAVHAYVATGHFPS